MNFSLKSPDTFSTSSAPAFDPSEKITSGNGRGSTWGNRLALAAVAVLGLGVSACSVLPQAAADPTRYFVLNAPASTENSSRISTQGAAIAIRSVDLPSYLRNTRSMVVRKGNNEVHYEDFSRWAEPIESGMTRALKESLAESGSVRSVAVFPLLAGDTRQFDLRVRVTRCEGGISAEGRSVALLSAVYEFAKVDADGEVVVRKTFTAPESTWDGRDFGELASRLSDAVGLLAAEIASNLPSS